MANKKRHNGDSFLDRFHEWDSQHRFLTWYVALVSTLILFLLIRGEW